MFKPNNNNNPPTTSSSSSFSTTTTALPGQVTQHHLNKHSKQSQSQPQSQPLKYPHRLNFYEDPPRNEITIEEFENWGIDRLRILSEIDTSQSLNKPYETIKTHIVSNPKINKLIPLSPNSHIKSRAWKELENERFKDVASHFVLRLAFCRSPDLKSKFIRTESTLFKIRFENELPNDRKAFLDALDFEWDEATDSEKLSLWPSLHALNPQIPFDAVPPPPPTTTSKAKSKSKSKSKSKKNSLRRRRKSHGSSYSDDEGGDYYQTDEDEMEEEGGDDEEEEEEGEEENDEDEEEPEGILRDEARKAREKKEEECKMKRDKEVFYKVHWTRVPDLISQRRVFVKKGMAYVHSNYQINLVLVEFTNRLSRWLEQTSLSLPHLSSDTRILPLLSHLSLGFSPSSSTFSSDEFSTGDIVTANMVEGLSQKGHFPPCMKHLQERLSKEKHLRHWGRLQFNLFLKGIGMPIEEAVAYWRRSFSNITDDKFNREYKYNIRHGYGLEGRRMNYPPKSCQSIITNNPPKEGDAHGCPFRHFSPSSLTNFLSRSYHITTSEQKEILDLLKGKNRPLSSMASDPWDNISGGGAGSGGGHCQVACTRLFEITHAKDGIKKGDGLGNSGETVVHPNRYYEVSAKLEKGERMDMS